MIPLALQVFSVVSLFTLVAAISAPSLDTASYSPSFIVTRDICVIGGGSSGTYAAIGLRDRGKSVAVVEAQSVLGGHTNTYTDPATKATIDYGVVVFENTSAVTSYFSRFNIPLTAVPSAGGTSLKEYYVDLTSGARVSSYVPVDPTAAFGAYAAQLAKYPFLNTPGWHLPSPVPADLLIPFGEFVKKYGLDGAVFTINEYAQGFGDILSIPTVYILKYFGLSVLQGAQTAFMTTARHDNSELYEKARTELGSDVFLNSKVVAMDRSSNGVKVAIRTPQGFKLILAKRLVISIPPLLSNLAGFDLSNTERSLFGQFLNGAYYTTLLNDTGIPDDVDITNVGANTPYNLPKLPGVFGISPTGVSGLKDVKYAADSGLPDSAVQASIVSEIQKLKTAGTIKTAETPKFVTFNSHTPYELRVSADAVAAGFYTKLIALQGQRNTWYTGAAFDRHDSGDLWAYTAGLLPAIAG